MRPGGRSPPWARGLFFPTPDDAREGLFEEEATPPGEYITTAHVPCAGATPARKPARFYLREPAGELAPSFSAIHILASEQGSDMRDFLSGLLATVAEGQHSGLPSSFQQTPHYNDRLADYLRVTESSSTMRSVLAKKPWVFASARASQVGSLYYVTLEFTLPNNKVVRLRGVFTIGQSTTSMLRRLLRPGIGHVHAFRAALLAVLGEGEGSAAGGTIHVMFAWCALVGLAAVPDFTGVNIILTAIPCGHTLGHHNLAGHPPPRKLCSVYAESCAYAVAYGWARERCFVAGFGAAMQASGKGGFAGRIRTEAVSDELRALLAGVGSVTAKQCPRTVPALLVQLRLFLAARGAAAGGGGGGALAAAAAEAEPASVEADVAEEGEDTDLPWGVEAEDEVGAPVDLALPPAPPGAEKHIVLQLLVSLHALLPLAAAAAEPPSSPALAVASTISQLHRLADSLVASDRILEGLMGVQDELLDFVARGVHDAVLTRRYLARLQAYDFSPPPPEAPGAVPAAARALLEALGVPLQADIALPPRTRLDAPGAGAGWEEVLPWLSATLTSFAFAARPAQAAAPPAPTALLRARCLAAIQVLDLVAAEQAAAVSALTALDSAVVLGTLRGAFARGHEAVLGLCWDDEPAAA
jgi:hypothetical protein